MRAAITGAGFKRAAIVGHSYGSTVASRLVQEYPGVVEALVLLDPVSIGEEGGCWGRGVRGKGGEGSGVLGGGVRGRGGRRMVLSHAAFCLLLHLFLVMPSFVITDRQPPQIKQNLLPHPPNPHCAQVCFHMYLPDLLTTFLYTRSFTSGHMLLDAVMRCVSTEVHCTAAFSRNFFWTRGWGKEWGRGGCVRAWRAANTVA